MLRYLIKDVFLGNRVPIWAQDLKIFFILGMGRSGTNFLADMLSKCPDSLVYHEPFIEDFDAFVDAHASDKDALRYLSKFRLNKIRAAVKEKDIAHYGEVNSALRFHAKAIKAALPNAELLHLVRDGRDVVRSVMERKHYTEGATGHHDLSPLPSDPLYEQWGRFSRFEKVCWLWADANRRLADEIPRRVAFEQLVSDYDYFRERLLLPLGLEMNAATWEKSVAAPVNTTKKFSYPHWRDWDAAQHAAFDAICAEQMAAYGYY